MRTGKGELIHDSNQPCGTVLQAQAPGTALEFALLRANDWGSTRRTCDVRAPPAASLAVYLTASASHQPFCCDGPASAPG